MSLGAFRSLGNNSEYHSLRMLLLSCRGSAILAMLSIFLGILSLSPAEVVHNSRSWGHFNMVKVEELCFVGGSKAFVKDRAFDRGGDACPIRSL